MTDQTADQRLVAAWPISLTAANILPIVVACCGVVGLLFYRNSRLFISPEFWAEDVLVYFVQDRQFGINAALIPHNGFIQFICRIIAWLGGFLDPQNAPRFYACAFVASIFATAAITYTSPLFRGWSKPLAAIVLLAVPVNSEVFLGMCYTQWVMGPLVALALCERPTGVPRGSILAIAFTIVGLSSPFVLVAAPFVALKAFTERSRYPYTLCAIVVASGLFHSQYIIKRFAGSASRGGLSLKIDAFFSAFYRWAAGDTSVSQLAAVLISVAVAVSVSWYLWSHRRTAKGPILYFFSFGFVLLAVSCASIEGSDRVYQFGPGARYFYIPAVLFLWFAISIEQDFRRYPRSASVAVLMLSGLLYWHVDRDERYYSIHTNWAETVECLKTDRDCTTIPNPTFLGSARIPNNREAMATR